MLSRRRGGRRLAGGLVSLLDCKREEGFGGGVLGSLLRRVGGLVGGLEQRREL